MLHVGYRCHSVRAAVSRRSSLGVSKAEPSGSIQAALSTSRGKATAAEKKASLSFSLTLSASHSHPNNVPLPFHVLFISPQLQEILLLFNCFQRLNPLHTKSGCHYIKYYLRLGLNRRTIVRCDTGQRKKKDNGQINSMKQLTHDCRNSSPAHRDLLYANPLQYGYIRTLILVILC